MGEPAILVLGVGNVLWADEGFGVRCAERLAATVALPEHVTVLDGGTQGLGLMPYLQAADRLILFDAVDFGGEPGELIEVRNDAVPRFIGAKKMSLHQAGMQDVLACTDLLGGLPDEMVLIGVQPVELEDYGGSLRPAVRDQLDPAIGRALAVLREWGVKPRDADAACVSVGVQALGLERYEAERPSAEDACRYGDERVLARQAGRVA